VENGRKSNFADKDFRCHGNDGCARETLLGQCAGLGMGEDADLLGRAAKGYGGKSFASAAVPAF